MFHALLKLIDYFGTLFKWLLLVKYCNENGVTSIKKHICCIFNLLVKYINGQRFQYLRSKPIVFSIYLQLNEVSRSLIIPHSFFETTSRSAVTRTPRKTLLAQILMLSFRYFVRLLV